MLTPFRNPLVICFVLLSLATQAFAYGREGHRAVGQMAQTRLNKRAADAIAKILANDKCKTLECVAPWPDDLKTAARSNFTKGSLAGDDEAKAFQKDFKDNDKWHFVNLPLASAEYKDDGEFSNQTDIVHMINTCIAILEGKSTEFTQLQALRFLVHLVGDIHQPLHVGTGFYTLDNTTVTLIREPADAAGKQTDIGGNSLAFTRFDNQPDELHSFWDTCLIQKLTKRPTCVLESKMPATEFSKLATELNKTVNADAFKTPGDFHTWAEQWATDSVHQASEIYNPVVFGKATLNTSKKRFQTIAITLPATYTEDQLPRARTQISKAGIHLGQLLNSIDWKE